MFDQFNIADDGVEQISLKSYTEKAYLDYSMYVILDTCAAERYCRRFKAGTAAYCLCHE